MDVQHGTANVSVSFGAYTTATGAAVTVTSATTGLALWYRRDGGLKVALASVNDLATLDAAHNDEGILVISGQEHRLDLPDAAFVTGVSKVAWGGEATGITIDGGEANLVAYNPADAVRLGLTALPNAAADAAGGLPISDAGALDLDNRMLSAAAVTNLNLSAGVILPGTVDTGSFAATTTQFEADDITEATADHFIGRVVIFTSGALQYQATTITDYALSGANAHFTVDALTEAPANDVTFIVI